MARLVETLPLPLVCSSRGRGTAPGTSAIVVGTVDAAAVLDGLADWLRESPGTPAVDVGAHDAPEERVDDAPSTPLPIEPFLMRPPTFLAEVFFPPFLTALLPVRLPARLPVRLPLPLFPLPALAGGRGTHLVLDFCNCSKGGRE